MIRELIIAFLGAVVGIVCLNYVLDSNGHGSKDVDRLKLENDSLVKANLKLDSLEKSYLSELNNANFEILKLESQDNTLEARVKNMNKEITIIKTKYEKAKHYADSYGSDDIKRYFSNLR